MLDILRSELKASSNAITISFSIGKWKGKEVVISGDVSILNCEHDLEVMHHRGFDGKHYCPTMFLYCPYCGGLADEPEPYECNKWNEK